MEPKYWVALMQPSVKAASTGFSNGLAPAVFRKRHLAALISSTFISMAALSDAFGQPSQPSSSGAATGPGPGSVNQAAPTATSPTGAVTTLDTISVSGQRSTDPADVPYTSAGSAAYISGDEIERFRGTSVGDFLSGIPGVMNADARNSGAVDINIRGMQGQGRVPVIVDGATQETTVWQGYNGATPRTYIDPDFISTVSVEKGISSAADATGATGGVVRASTIGVKDILMPGRSFGIRLKGGLITNSSPVPPPGTSGGWDSLRTSLQVYGGALPTPDSVFYSEGMRRPALFKPTGGSGSIAVASTTEYVDFVAGYVRRKNGNYHAGTKGSGSARLIAEWDPRYGELQVGNGGLSAYRAGEEILNTSIDNTSWMLKSIFKLGNAHTLEVGYRKYLSDFGHLLTSRLEGSPYQSWLSTIDLDTYTARYKWNPENNGLIDLKVDAFLSALDNRINALDMLESWDDSDSIRPTARTLASFYQWTESKRRGVTVSNTSRFSTLVGDINLEYGGAFLREDTGLPRGVDMEHYTYTLGGEPPREGWRKEISGFTALQWRPKEWLTASASTRYSHFKTLDQFHQRTTDFERKDGGWSSLFSIKVEPKEGLQLYTKYGRSVRAPSIFESLSGPSFYYPVEQNPLKLERAQNLEVGINFVKEDAWLVGDKLRIHGAYFHNHIDDYITRAGLRRMSVSPWGHVSYVESLGRINLDYADMRGLEASVRYDTGRYFGSLAWNHYLRVMFCAPKGLLLDDEPICRAGGLPHSYSLQQVPPRDTVTLNMGTRLMQKKLQLGTRVSYIGSRFAPGFGKKIGMSGVQPSRWSPYTLVDVYAGYKHSNHVSLDLAIDNLTDRYYMDALNAAQMPAPGRTIRGNVTIKF